MATRCKSLAVLAVGCLTAVVLSRWDFIGPQATHRTTIDRRTLRFEEHEGAEQDTQAAKLIDGVCRLIPSG